jgi:hypothetical protein
MGDFMNPKLEQIADLISPTQHCEAALEPVVRRLIADKMPTEAIIAALASLTAHAVDQ